MPTIIRSLIILLLFAAFIPGPEVPECDYMIDAVLYSEIGCEFGFCKYPERIIGGSDYSYAKISQQNPGWLRAGFGAGEEVYGGLVLKVINPYNYQAGYWMSIRDRYDNQLALERFSLPPNFDGDWLIPYNQQTLIRGVLFGGSGGLPANTLYIDSIRGIYVECYQPPPW